MRRLSYREGNSVVPRLGIATGSVVNTGNPTDSGSTPAEGGEVGLRNIELVVLAGLYPTDTPPIAGGYEKVISIVLIYAFDKQLVVPSMTLALDKEHCPAGGSHMMDFDITLIIMEPVG
jgi:hypothetical protein